MSKKRNDSKKQRESRFLIEKSANCVLKSILRAIFLHVGALRGLFLTIENDFQLLNQIHKKNAR
jgi:hypothetical protein